jgi:hypothetical protein
MHKFIPSLCLMGLLLIPGLLPAQQGGTTYIFKAVGWTMTLPPEFKIVDSAKSADLKEAGRKIVGDANNIKLDVSSTRILIGAMKAPRNNFSAAITPFDPQKDGPYSAVRRRVKEILYKTFVEKIPDGKIDSSSTNIIIDGLAFDKFQVVVALKGKTLFHMVLLAKDYKGYDFGISYLYMDDTTRDQVETILSTCKFSK